LPLCKDTINIRNIPAKDKEILSHRLKALLARQIWRTEGYYEVSNTFDPVVSKALSVVEGK
jgi:carboxyl-terminal processing protease